MFHLRKTKGEEAVNLETVVMPKDVARAKFVEYRDAVRRRHSHEDEAIMRGYRALAKGGRVISLTTTIRAGGVNSMGRPNLAVSRADAKLCWLRVTEAGAVTFSMDQWLRHNATRRYVLLPEGTLPQGKWTRDVRAIVPNVPPRFRPNGSLSNYHVLWEADWSLVAPKDPALLRRIGGDLWAVLAVWDLTELERLVLMDRAN